MTKENRLLSFLKNIQVKRKLKKTIIFLLLFLLIISIGLLLFIWLTLHSPKIQSFLTEQATKVLANRLETEVSTDRVYVDIYNNILLEGLLIKDYEKDTFLYAKKIQIDIDELAILKKKLLVQGIDLDGVQIDLHKQKGDSLFNAEKLLRKLLGDSTNTDKEETKEDDSGTLTWELALEDIRIQNPNVTLRDEENGVLGHAKWEDLQLHIDQLNLDKQYVQTSDFKFTQPNFALQIDSNQQVIKGKLASLLVPDLKADWKQHIYETSQLQLKAPHFEWENGLTAQLLDAQLTDLGLSQVKVNLKDSLANAEAIDLAGLDLVYNNGRGQLIAGGDLAKLDLDNLQLDLKQNTFQANQIDLDQLNGEFNDGNKQLAIDGALNSLVITQAKLKLTDSLLLNQANIFQANQIDFNQFTGKFKDGSKQLAIDGALKSLAIAKPKFNLTDSILSSQQISLLSPDISLQDDKNKMSFDGDWKDLTIKKLDVELKNLAVKSDLIQMQQPNVKWQTKQHKHIIAAANWKDFTLEKLNFNLKKQSFLSEILALQEAEVKWVNVSNKKVFYTNIPEINLPEFKAPDLEKLLFQTPEFSINQPYIAVGQWNQGDQIPRDTLFYADRLATIDNSIGVKNNNFALKSILLDNPVIQLLKFQGEKAFNVELLGDIFDLGNPVGADSISAHQTPGSPNPNIQLDQVKITNLRFLADDPNKKVAIQAFSKLLNINIDQIDLANGVYKIGENDLENIYLTTGYHTRYQANKKSLYRDTLVHIPSIDLAPLSISLKDQRVDGAYLKLHRPNIILQKRQGEQEFNYEQFGKLFSSDKPNPTENKESVPSNKPPPDWTIALRNLELKQPKFLYADDIFTIVDVALENANIDIEQIKTKDQLVQLDQADVDQLKVKLTLNDDGEPDDTVYDEAYYNELVAMSPELLKVTANRIRLNDGYFSLDNKGSKEEPIDAINYNRMRVMDIQGDVSNLVYGDDQVTGIVHHLSAKERSGLVINKASGEVLVSSQKVEINNLDLQTPNTRLGNYLSLSYPSFRCFYDFLDRVKIDADIKNAYYTFKDLHYFAPQLKDVAVLQRNMDQPVKITSGKVKGTVSKLQAKDLIVDFGDLHYEGSVKLRGLPDIYSTNINFKVKDFETDIAAIKKLVPDVELPANIDLLGRLKFTGKFRGFPKNFVADGTLETEIGTITSDLQMNLEEEIPTYSGDLAVEKFQIGRWLKRTDLLDIISFDVTVEDGKGFNFNTLAAKVKGEVSEVTFKDYLYQNIALDGAIKQKIFKGLFKIEDENVQLGFSGKVDFTEKIPSYQLYANTQKINLEALNLVPKGKFYSDLILSGVTSLKLSGTDIDNIEGEASFKKLTIVKDTTTLVINNVALNSFTMNNNKKAITFSSDILDAKLKGLFSYKEIAFAVQNYLHTYFPYNFDFTQETSPQDLTFKITIKNPISFTELLVPGLEQLDTATIAGQFNTNTKEMDLFATTPRIIFDGNTINAFMLYAQSDEQHIWFDTKTDSVVTKQGFTIPRIDLSGDVHHDSIEYRLAIAPDSADTRVRLDGLLFANVDRLLMNFSNTEIVINDKRWAANTGTFMYKNQDLFAIENILLTQGKQKISLESSPDPLLNNITTIQIDNLIISDFKEISAIESLGLDGTLNSQIKLQDIFQRQLIEANIAVDSLHFLNQEMGKLRAVVGKVGNEQDVTIDAVLDDDKYAGTGKGKYQLPSEEYPLGLIDVDLDLKKASLLFLEPFIGSFVSNLDGSGKIQLKLAGPTSDPRLSGTVWINKAIATIDYLGTTYSAKNEKLLFEENKLIFPNTIIKDEQNNLATLNGYLDLNDYQDISLDISLDTDKFHFLNTNFSDNETFYGTAYGNANCRFYGNMEVLTMEINGQTLPNTFIDIPISYEEEIVENKIYTFINTGVDTLSLQVPTDTLESGMEFIIKMDLDITPDALLRIILDQQSGDIIASRGTGNVQMYISTVGDFDFRMYGPYTIENGEYLFSIQNIINKKFSVQKGGTINFTGNPYDARLDLSAIYSLRTARYEAFSESEKQNFEFNPSAEEAAKKRVPIDVLLNLTGSLSNPTIDFDIDQSTQTVPIVDQLFEQKIDLMTNEEDNELNKQIFGLLILNQFIPPESFDLDLQSGINTTVSEFLSNYLFGYLNDVLSGIIPDSEISLSLNRYTSDALQEEFDEAPNIRNEIGLTFTKRLFEDRVSVNIGGNVDVGNEIVTGDKVAIAGDFIVVYNITPDGRFQLKAFNKFDYDIFLHDYNKVGVGVKISRDFDRLFRRKGLRDTIKVK